MYRLYRNLNNGRISIKDKRTNLVVGYADEVWVENPKFIVSEAGRQRVLEEKRKNVHAYIEGSIVKLQGFLPRNNGQVDVGVLHQRKYHEGVQLNYNPYKYPHFYVVTEYDGVEMYEAVHSAGLVMVKSDGRMLVWE